MIFIMIIKNNSLLSGCLLVMVLAHNFAVTLANGNIETSQIAVRAGGDLHLRSNDDKMPSKKDRFEIPDDDEPVEHRFNNPLTFLKGAHSFIKRTLAMPTWLMAQAMKCKRGNLQAVLSYRRR